MKKQRNCWSTAIKKTVFCALCIVPFLSTNAYAAGTWLSNVLITEVMYFPYDPVGAPTVPPHVQLKLASPHSDPESCGRTTHLEIAGTLNASNDMDPIEVLNLQARLALATSAQLSDTRVALYFEGCFGNDPLVKQIGLSP